jgi:hypothetical protein
MMLRTSFAGLPACALSLCMLIFLLAGCNRGPRTEAVTGKVTVGTQPVANGSLRFIPDKDKGNTSELIGAATIENGTYTAYTNAKPGVPAGWYKVAVVAEEEVDSTNPVQKRLVDAKYNDPEKTPLSVEVVPNAPAGAYDFDVSQ